MPLTRNQLHGRAPQTFGSLGLLALALLLAPDFAGSARAASSPWSENPQSSVRLITPYEVAPRNGNLLLGLHFKLSPGWHVYWKNSGDAGFPPVVVLEKTAGLGDAGDAGDAEILWPAPHRFELPGGLVAFGYEDEVVYPVRTTVQAAGDPIGDSIAISAALDYLVCEVDCIPYRYDLKLTQRLGDAEVPDPQTAPLLETALSRLPVPPERLAGVETSGRLIPGTPPALEVRLNGAQAEPGEVDLFLEPHDLFDTGKPEVRQDGDGLVFRVPLAARDARQQLPESTTFAWTLTGLEKDGRPASVEARRTVTAAPAPGPGTSPPSTGLSPRLLLLAFLGGLALNLMPSVLALLVPSLLELRRSAAISPRAARAEAGAAAGAVVGVALCAAALFSLSAFRGSPWMAGWGAQLQEPPVAALLTLASAWLALNLWGLVGAPLPPAGHPGHPGPLGLGRAALLGALTPLLAGAWILPTLAEPVGVAAAGGGAALLAVFTALGLGLALPYLAVAAAPGILSRLPGFDSRPLREALGFAAAAGTFWLLYALSRQVSAEGLAWIELALLAMALFAWLRHRSATRAALRFVLTVCLLTSAALALWLADRNRLDSRISLINLTNHGVNPDLILKEESDA